jgi:septal ring factor EnvC (AmiA/AmiB activator)
MQKMAADIHALEANIEALRAAQSKTAKSVSALDGLSARLDGAKSETTALIAALADRIGRIQREPDSKLSQMADRLDRIERNLASQAAAAAQKQPQITAATAKPQGDAAEGQRKPRLITTWVVRDVYDGTALVESARGMIEVAPGEILPGAGRVKSIERRGSGWILITSEGVVDSIRNRF